MTTGRRKLRDLKRGRFLVTLFNAFVAGICFYATATATSSVPLPLRLIGGIMTFLNLLMAWMGWRACRDYIHGTKDEE